MRFFPLSKFGAGSAPPFHFCAPQELPAGGGGRGPQAPLTARHCYKFLMYISNAIFI